jgi:NTE family protein
MRVGLVLGAGGVVGASWLIGALEALESQTGFSPGDADVVVGTSAGSVVGALVAAGLPPALLAAYSSGEPLELQGFADVEETLAEIARESPDRFRLQLSLPPIGPGSWRMALSTLRRPLHHTPAAVVGGWLPRGVISTGPVRHLVDRLVGETWPATLRVVTCDYRTGRRAVFGAPDAAAGGLPEARPSDAVAASCAIPGFYHPVAIGGRRFVDGGVCSMSNLDLLCDEDVDVAIVLNPTSSRANPRRTLNPAAMAFGALNGAVRGASARRLDGEVRKLRAAGVEVVVIEPSAADLALMGHNPMSRRRRAEITEQAYRSVSRSLRRRTTLPDLRSGAGRSAASGARRERPVVRAA